MPWLQLNLLILIEILQGITICKAYKLPLPKGTICKSHLHLCIKQESPKLTLITIFSKEEVDADLINFNPLTLFLILIIILV